MTPGRLEGVAFEPSSKLLGRDISQDLLAVNLDLLDLLV